MIIGYGIIAVPTGIVTFEFARASAPVHREFVPDVVFRFMSRTPYFASVAAPSFDLLPGFFYQPARSAEYKTNLHQNITADGRTVENL
jgi:hypothetical protein